MVDCAACVTKDERIKVLETALASFVAEAKEWVNCTAKDDFVITTAHIEDVRCECGCDGEIDGLNDGKFTLGDLRNAIKVMEGR